MEPPAMVQAAPPAPVLATSAASPTEVVTSSAPVVVVKPVTVTQSIPFKTTRIDDSSLPQGTTKVRTQGVNGSKTLTYEVTFTDGAETSRKLVREVVTKQPVTKVILVGTKKPSCDLDHDNDGVGCD
jgi:resuscitation-promoting factor RpfB